MSELPGECISAIPEEQGCACKWIAEKSKAPLQGLAKAGNAKTQDEDKCPAAGQPGYDECSSAAASAAACEAWCCHGPDGKGPPIVTSDPAHPLQPKTGPCGAWQWAPGDLLGTQGCWVGVDPSIQQLPHNENGKGPWVGAQGNLGGRSSGWGAVFLLVFCVVAVGYVTTFGYLNYRSGKRGWRQLEPHRHCSQPAVPSVVSSCRTRMVAFWIGFCIVAASVYSAAPLFELVAVTTAGRPRHLHTRKSDTYQISDANQVRYSCSGELAVF
jgi:hypothetical protein